MKKILISEDAFCDINDGFLFSMHRISDLAITSPRVCVLTLKDWRLRQVFTERFMDFTDFWAEFFLMGFFTLCKRMRW